MDIADSKSSRNSRWLGKTFGIEGENVQNGAPLAFKAAIKAIFPEFRSHDGYEEGPRLALYDVMEDSLASHISTQIEAATNSGLVPTMDFYGIKDVRITGSKLLYR